VSTPVEAVRIVDGETHGVPFTVDANGLVLVDGTHVRTPAGKLLGHRESFESFCQLCCRNKVTVPLHLIREDARNVYWFGGAWPWAKLARARCTSCAEREASS
jgi:hypothetical protein